MTMQQIITAINKEWDSSSMIQFSASVESILAIRLPDKNPYVKDILNNTNHILAQLISNLERTTNPIIYCVYAAVGLRVMSLYCRPDKDFGFAAVGNSVETLPWECEYSKEEVLSMFLKSMEEDFKIEILSKC